MQLLYELYGIGKSSLLTIQIRYHLRLSIRLALTGADCTGSLGYPQLLLSFLHPVLRLSHLGPACSHGNVEGSDLPYCENATRRLTLRSS